MQINRTVAQLTAAGILLSGSILLTGCGKKDAPPPPGPQEVSVVSVVSQQLAMTTELPGRTSSFQIAEVRPQVGGIIQNACSAKAPTSRLASRCTRLIRPPIAPPTTVPAPRWPRPTPI